MLEARDLAGRRGTTQLFANVSLDVAPGEALIVGGPNGTGKTTLLRMLAGLTEPDAGEIRWRGVRTAPFASRLRGDVAWAGHATALKDELTAEENLVSLVSLAGRSVSRDEARAALASVALASQAALPARVLSAGQRRRVGLARLALLQRPLWILDEPATALDADGIGSLLVLLRDRLARGGTVVAATHQPLDLDARAVKRMSLGR